MFGLPEALRKKKTIPVSVSLRDPSQSQGRTLAPSQETYYNRSYNSTRTKTQWSKEQENQSVTHTESKFGKTPTSGMTGTGTLVASGNEQLEQLLLTVHQKASSQMVGVEKMNHAQNSKPPTNQPTRSLTGYGSSSTLHSFYDPQHISSAISQQTSESSARDFALRKGCPPVVSITKSNALPSHAGQDLEATTVKSVKKGPRRFDLSMLFPKPSTRYSRHGVSTDGGSPFDATADQWNASPHVPMGPRSSQQQKSNDTKTTHTLPRRQHGKQPPAVCHDPGFVETNTRKPKGGSKNWFDDIEDMDSERDVIDNELQPRTDFSRILELPVTNSSNNLETQCSSMGDQTHANNKNQETAISSSSYLQSLSTTDPMLVSPAGEHLRLALRNWEFRGGSHVTTSRKSTSTNVRKRRNQAFDKADLLKESVLFLSSSEDESEDDNPELDLGTTIPGIRDSLVVDPLDSDVEIGTAHAIKTTRPVLEEDSPRRRDRTRVSHLSDPSLTVRDVSESRVGNRQTFLSDQSKAADITPSISLPSSMTGNTASNRASNYLDYSSTASQKADSLTRLMTVTQQEETLLEAMRSKKVNMRKRIMAEAIRSVGGEDQAQSVALVDRPRPSVVDANHASFLHLSAGSIPNIGGYHKHRRSASAGGIPDFSGQAFRVSESADSAPSRRDSFARSSLPSSSSHDTPPTPTLAHARDTASRRTSSSTKRYSTLPLGFQRHSRERTGSSHVIVLDSPDDNHLGQFQEHDLLLSWQYDGWNERAAGLAIVD